MVATTKVDAVVQQKSEKYQDLPALLESSDIMNKMGLKVVKDPVILVMDGEGRDIPASTLQSMETLASFLYPTDAEFAKLEAYRCCQMLLNLI